MTGIASIAQLRMSLLRYALFSVPLVLLLGTLSARIAGSGYGNAWFDTLEKPAFAPPAWAFAFAWTLLYLLLGLALAMLLHARGAHMRGAAIALFLVQLLASYFWSPLFFAFHQVGQALLLTGVMIALTVALVVLLWQIRRLAALLLLPYLAWLCFAAVLTASIDRLNPDAATLAPAAARTDIPL